MDFFHELRSINLTIHRSEVHATLPDNLENEIEAVPTAPI